MTSHGSAEASGALEASDWAWYLTSAGEKACGRAKATCPLLATKRHGEEWSITYRRVNQMQTGAMEQKPGLGGACFGGRRLDDVHGRAFYTQRDDMRPLVVARLGVGGPRVTRLALHCIISGR